MKWGPYPRATALVFKTGARSAEETSAYRPPSSGTPAHLMCRTASKGTRHMQAEPCVRGNTETPGLRTSCEVALRSHGGEANADGNPPYNRVLPGRGAVNRTKEPNFRMGKTVDMKRECNKCPFRHRWPPRATCATRPTHTPPHQCVDRLGSGTHDAHGHSPQPARTHLHTASANPLRPHTRS